jgi:hypothetical protein
VKLLMPAALYSASSPLEATLYNRSYLLVPLRLLEAGPDYELGLFKAQRPRSPSGPAWLLAPDLLSYGTVCVFGGTVHGFRVG